MNWGLIPEVFFDVIGRILPGCLFLVGCLAVHFGPGELSRVLSQSLPSANAASLLLFVLFAYFAAIALKGIWDVLARLPRSKGQTAGTQEAADDRPISDPFLTIQERLPFAASRLLKLQAEKNVCEVLLPGLAILLVGDAWSILMGIPEELAERVALAVVLLVFSVVCWRWRKGLETIYQRDLETSTRWVEENSTKTL